MAAEGEIKSENMERFEWNVDNEIRLFEAMIGYKPVGIHKHFNMACICEKFESLLGKSVSPEVIWEHLNSMYDLAALDKKETTPFPNEVEEFTLPVADFSELIAEKITKSEIVSESATSATTAATTATTTGATAATNSNTSGIATGTGTTTPTTATAVKDDKSASKVFRESSQGSFISKKERKIDQEDISYDGDGKDADEDVDGRKGKLKKEEKPVGKRGKRSLKDRKNEEDSLQVSTPSVKKGDDDSSTIQSYHKKGKRMIGKRSLRTRADDAPCNKSSTPPPRKRARRI